MHATPRVWSKTAHGEISIARPVSGLELLSLRDWNRPWSGSVSGLGLVLNEAPAPAEARVAGMRRELGLGIVLCVPAKEHYSLVGHGALSASIVAFDSGLMDRPDVALPLRARVRPWIASVPQLDTALRRLISRVAADGSSSCAPEYTAVMRELAAVTLPSPLTPSSA